MLSRLPRRSCSQPSSEVRQRIATSVSWRSVRRGRVGVDVARGDGVDAEVLGEVAQGGVASHVAALVRPLQLDEEALAPEGAGEPGGGVRVAHGEPVPRAAGEADETLRMLLDEASGRRTGAAARDPPALAGGCPRAPR